MGDLTKVNRNENIVDMPDVVQNDPAPDVVKNDPAPEIENSNLPSSITSNPYNPNEAISASNLREWVPLYMIAAGTKEMLNFDINKASKYFPKRPNSEKHDVKHSSNEAVSVFQNAIENTSKTGTQELHLAFRQTSVVIASIVILAICMVFVPIPKSSTEIVRFSEAYLQPIYGNCTLYEEPKSCSNCCYFDERRFLETVSCTRVYTGKIASELKELKKTCSFRNKNSINYEYRIPALMKRVSQEINYSSKSFIISSLIAFLIISYMLLKFKQVNRASAHQTSC